MLHNLRQPGPYAFSTADANALLFNWKVPKSAWRAVVGLSSNEVPSERCVTDYGDKLVDGAPHCCCALLWI